MVGYSYFVCEALVNLMNFTHEIEIRTYLPYLVPRFFLILTVSKCGNVNNRVEFRL